MSDFEEATEEYADNIEYLTIDNEEFRRILYTDRNFQLVVMSLQRGEIIEREKHDGSQFIRIESGVAEVIIYGSSRTVYNLKSGSFIIIPENTEHRVKCISNGDLKLYTIYAKPQHGMH